MTTEKRNNEIRDLIICNSIFDELEKGTNLHQLYFNKAAIAQLVDSEIESVKTKACILRNLIADEIALFESRI